MLGVYERVKQRRHFFRLRGVGRAQPFKQVGEYGYDVREPEDVYKRQSLTF